MSVLGFVGATGRFFAVVLEVCVRATGVFITQLYARRANSVTCHQFNCQWLATRGTLCFPCKTASVAVPEQEVLRERIF